MLNTLMPFLLHWGVTSLSLWVASYVFSGIRFADKSSLVVSALLLGFANAIIRPLLVILTLPLTLITLGFFLLVINALMLLLVSSLVRGFTISGFWTAFFASIFIAVLSFAIGALLAGDAAVWQPPGKGRWVEAPSVPFQPHELTAGLREMRPFL
jgi:putative membrane protein